MTITELMYYGSYYRDLDEGYHLWWFDPQENKIYQYEDLLKTFGYHSEADILAVGAFIPLFRTDITALKYQFILSLRSKKLQSYFDKLPEADLDGEFNIFVEREHLIHLWGDFERKQLFEDAVKWCRDNHITGIKIE